MKDYIHKGSQPLEFPGQCRVEPSAEGTRFSAELDEGQERSLVAAGLIEVAPEKVEEPEGQSARKGRR